MPARRRALLPVAARASDAVTAEGTAEADSQPAAEERPVDEAELRQEIERTREQLGETVEQLAAKTDVKGRARAKAAELAGRAKSTDSPGADAGRHPSQHGAGAARWQDCGGTPESHGGGRHGQDPVAG